MKEKLVFTDEEKGQAEEILKRLKKTLSVGLLPDDGEKLQRHIGEAMERGELQRDVFGLNPVLHALETAEIAVEEIGLKRDAVVAIILYAGIVGG